MRKSKLFLEENDERWQRVTDEERKRIENMVHTVQKLHYQTYEKYRRGELLSSAKPRYYCLGQYLHYAVLRQEVIVLNFR